MNQYGKRKLYSPKRIIAVGDVHGESQKLEALLNKIKLNTDDHLVFTGDLLGFAGDNYQTLRLLKNQKESHNNTFFIEGNHDYSIKKFLEEGGTPFPHFESLIQNIPAGEITKEILNDFLKDKNLLDIFEDMIPYYETEKCIITHAPIVAKQWLVFGGLDYLENLDPDNLESKLILDKMSHEIKYSFLDNEKEVVPSLDKFLICGHQYLEETKFGWPHKAPRVFKHRAFIDCGCGYIPSSKLFALEYPSKKIIKS